MNYNVVKYDSNCNLFNVYLDIMSYYSPYSKHVLFITKQNKLSSKTLQGFSYHRTEQFMKIHDVITYYNKIVMDPFGLNIIRLFYISGNHQTCTRFMRRTIPYNYGIRKYYK